MKICVLYPSPIPKGGVYNHIVNLKHWLEKFGHEVQVSRIKSLRYFGRLHSYLYNAIIAKEFSKIAHHFDIIHAMSGGGFSFSFLHRLTRSRIPFVTTYHGSWLRIDKMVRRFGGYNINDIPLWLLVHPIEEGSKLPSLHEADKILAVSKYLKKVLAEDYKISEEKIGVCYNGVDIERFKPESRTANSEPVVLFMGYLVPWKGVAFYLKAIPLVLREAKAKFLIAGGGHRRVFYERMARILEISDYVTFLDYVPSQEMPSIYRSCDIYVHPSLMEAFGITIAEAMATAKPVIASNISAIPEIVQHRKTGILFEPANVGQLASAIIELISDPKLARRYGREGRRVVEDKFTWKSTAGRVLHTYEEVAG